MIEKITHKKKLFALIIKKRFRKLKGIKFFTENSSSQQIGYMSHRKNHIILPHKHNKRLTQILTTTEVIVLFKGILRVDFYTQSKKYLFSKILRANDIIMLISGGHGFKVLKDIEMIEIKQGPYSLIKDKIKFENINDRKIKLRK